MKKLITTFLLMITLMFTICTSIHVSAETGIQDVRKDGEYIGRTFNADYDKMFDNFERATLESVEGTGLWWASSDGTPADLTDRGGYLHVEYNADLGHTKNNPVYKAASGANSEGAYQYLVFVMRGTGKIADLTLSFRYDDNHNDIDVPFNELVDPDLVTLPELTTEYQVYIVDILNSLDGYEYTKDGETPITAGSAMVGFHLLSNAEKEGTIDIKEVYYSKEVNTLGYVEGAANSLIDLFQREDVHEPVGIYWCGSSGRIILNHLEMNGESSYKSAGYDAANPTGTYNNLVLRMRGSARLADLTISTMVVTQEGDVWSTPVSFAELIGPDGQTLPEIWDGFMTFVVDLEASNLDKNMNGLKITNAKNQLFIDQIFFTNMEYNMDAIATDFPVLNTEDIVLWDNFSREKVGATAQYDGNNPTALDNGFAFIIAYAGIDRMSIENDALVFDCTANGDYLQYTCVSTTNVNDGTYPYVVFKIKTTDGGDLSNFRIATISADDKRSNVVWANGGLKSGSGFPAAKEAQDGYRYVAQDGYMYLIVDLEASALGTAPEGFDLFYSGTGKLWIDSIFFAKEGKDVPTTEKEIIFDDFNREEINDSAQETSTHWWYDSTCTIFEGALKMDATGNQYVSYRTAAKQGHNNKDDHARYLAITMKGEEGTTLEAFRFCTVSPDGERVFANANAIILADGTTLSTTALTTEYQTFVIDLVASKVEGYASEGLCVEFGGWAAGVLYIDEIKYIPAVDIVGKIEEKIVELSVKPVVLVVPTIAVANDLLTITTTDEGVTFEIYVDGVLKTTTTEKQVNLKSLLTNEGTYEITVKATKEEAIASEESSSVTYKVEKVTPTPTPTPSKKGCFGSVVFSSIATFALISACAFTFLKKRNK